MNRYLPLALLLGLAMSTAACDDEFLTTIPSDRISDATFWQSEQDFTYAINAAYREMRNWTTIYQDNPTDIAYSQQYWANLSDVARGINDSQRGPHGGYWSNYYEGLAKVNEVLSQLENVEPGILSATAEAQIKGQALFLRGYYYHELLWLFGGVPLLTEVPTPAEAKEAVRAPRADVFDRINADLTEAASLLPNTWPASQDGRATKGAALAYKARTALYEASHQKYGENNGSEANTLFGIARDAAKAVMDLGVYGLYPNFRDLFTYAGEGSNETILAYQHNSGQNGWPAWYDFAPTSQAGQEVALSPTRALVDMFYMTDGMLPSESPMYDPEPPVISYDGNTATVESLGMYADRDPRFYATVLFPGAPNFDGAIFNSYPACGTTGAADGYCSKTAEALDQGNFYNTFTGYLPVKYLDPTDRPNRSDSGINFMKIRYADVLLMYAEAKIELGTLDASVNDAFDQIRDRVDMPHVDVTGMSQAEAIALLRNERAVELAWEGLRYADIRRWRMAEDVMPGFAWGIDYYNASGTMVTAKSDIERVFHIPRDYLWPIPASELELNSNLTQNPGY